MEKFDCKRYEKSKAEEEAFWLKCIVDADIVPTYQAAENIWDSDGLMKDTQWNRNFWSKVLEMYNLRTKEHQDYLEREEVDGPGNPELNDGDIHHCFACHTELKPVFPDLHERGGTQYDNALIVHVDGGYGMFVDTPALQYSETDEDIELKQMSDDEKIQKGILDPFCVLICHDCAHDLCEKVPWMDRIVESESSHGDDEAGNE